MTKFPKLLGFLLLFLPLKSLNSYTEYVDISDYRICYARDMGGCLPDPKPEELPLPDSQPVQQINEAAVQRVLAHALREPVQQLTSKKKAKKRSSHTSSVKGGYDVFLASIEGTDNSNTPEEPSYRATSSRRVVKAAGAPADDVIKYALNMLPDAKPHEIYTGYKPAIAQGSYKSVLTDVKKHRQYLADQLERSQNNEERTAILKDAASLFTDAFLNHVMPFWYGTPWDFNGHTDYPGKGYVACGYLVSTTLTHLGVNVNRFTLAQQWPIDMVRSLCQNDYYHFGAKSEAIQGIRNMGYGLYLMGLDNHVGFIKYDQWGIHFIHSNWAGSRTVVSEDPQYSTAFTASQNFYVGKLSTNNTFITKWLNAGYFKVHKG